MDGGGDSPSTNNNLKSYVCRARQYMPYLAIAGSSVFIANYIHPSILNRPFGDRSLLAQNVCFVAAHVGVGMTLYDRLPKAPENWKSYAIASAGSLLFNHGSILLVGVTREILPDNSAAKLIAGGVTMATLFWISKEFLEIVSK